MGGIDTDPCASINSKHWFANSDDGNITERLDGLNHGWYGRVFINPPYGKIKTWVKKGFLEHTQGRATQQMWLVPGRGMETKWWFELMSYCRIFAIKRRRITFEGAKMGAQFPSALCYSVADKNERVEREELFIRQVKQAGYIPYRKA